MAGFLGDSRLALGCMRLSTDRERDEERAMAVLQGAFAAGLTFLDTADAYARDASEAGHNERLIARAREAWAGDRSRILIATKGGLVRPEGRWQSDGRARHLRAAAEASCRALGVARIWLYQLHAPDPRTPFTTSVRALDSLRRDGLVEQVGLCNVTVGQIEEARRLTEIAAVQVELSVWHDGALRSGVAGYCVANGIPLLAYRPLGGPERRRKTIADPVLAAVAARHGATPFEIALAWLLDLSPLIVPLPGATRPDTVPSIARAGEIRLADADRAVLDERFPAGRTLRTPRTGRHPPTDGEGEIVLVMGLPGAGKSTLALDLVGRGYARLNRDEAGGRLADLLPALDRTVAGGRNRVVLDNTYMSRKSRSPVVEKALEHGLPVRCLWLDTSLEDAQFNAVWRMVSRYGRLLGPEEMPAAAKADPGVFAPRVQFRHQRELEPPQAAEGFSQVEVVRFARRPEASHADRALLVWCDGILHRSRSGRRTPVSPDDVEVSAVVAATLRRHRDAGWRLLGLSWQPGIAEGSLGQEQVEACLARTRELLGGEIEILYCPHGAGPPTCWCRKPLPGLGVLFIQRHRLDPSQCVYVGEGGPDRAFARRLGFAFREAGEFFAP